MSLTLKVSSVIGTLGVVGGSAAIVNQLTKEHQTIKDALTKVGYHVLDLEKEDSDWDTVVNAYKATLNQSKPFGNITDKVGLRKECKKLLNSDLNNKANYSSASRWCVKEETIKAMLTRNKYKELGEATSEPSKVKWTEKVRLLKEAKDNKIIVTFNGTKDEETLANKCKSLDSIKTHADNEFEVKFIWAREWCSEK
ncbi:hypothetical protein A6V39_00690 [Candidatus Mycoplasma haematobovis]|uniref:Uncharacterized protein n=1 Tax=Candidatus Mycoplasma haematobovis TaxID=432608 RepID=A0A1A9QEA4_9MOLU|nr:hypothetical protein [Candidatus Mycoplasma haematobovis]OAL10568.1 hypothetical protein A6V39_00690 [Candidatus Mycoplasma haematobovis]